MNTRLYSKELFVKEFQDYLNNFHDDFYLPVRRVEIIKIKADRNLEVIRQLMERINKKHCQ